MELGVERCIAALVKIYGPGDDVAHRIGSSGASIVSQRFLVISLCTVDECVSFHGLCVYVYSCLFRVAATCNRFALYGGEHTASRERRCNRVNSSIVPVAVSCLDAVVHCPKWVLHVMPGTMLIACVCGSYPGKSAAFVLWMTP